MVWPLGGRKWTEPKRNWLRANEFQINQRRSKKWGRGQRGDEFKPGRRIDGGWTEDHAGKDPKGQKGAKGVEKTQRNRNRGFK